MTTQAERLRDAERHTKKYHTDFRLADLVSTSSFNERPDLTTSPQPAILEVNGRQNTHLQHRLHPKAGKRLPETLQVHPDYFLARREG